LPKIGWAGVFPVAIAFDLAAAALAFFVLRRMKVPAARPRAAADGGSGVQGVTAGAGGAWLVALRCTGPRRGPRAEQMSLQQQVAAKAKGAAVGA